MMETQEQGVYPDDSEGVEDPESRASQGFRETVLSRDRREYVVTEAWMDFQDPVVSF